MAAKVRVKIAVAVAQDGHWYAFGHECDEGQSRLKHEMYLLNEAKDFVGDKATGLDVKTCWIEADIVIPEPRVSIEGEAL